MVANTWVDSITTTWRHTMNRFQTTTAFICILTLAALATPAAGQAGQHGHAARNHYGIKTPEDMRLCAPAALKGTKAPVAFSHDRHGAIECGTCHHTWDGSGPVARCSAPGCHDQPGKQGAMTFYNAYHAKGMDRSCMGCHKLTAKQGRPAPVACNACHVK
jgi:hypothetical protein